ncbi:MAG: nicotinate-nucleotide--dimethylbenzimidazole phosphoribosyltransferase [Tepidimonas sp.]|nr:nicotinate-nucleotide--dimethylbenzimidazole phosphoribosyltransferase [Tepidimonas sp.]
MSLTPDDLPTVADLHDPVLAARLQALLDDKTKPLGALGRLEALAQRLGLILGTEAPQLVQPQLVVFAADHGLAAHGVSAYPSDVTWQMVENFLAGGAAVSVLARQHGLALTVVDCGVRHAFAPRPALVDAKVAWGTADALQQPAMTAEQCAQAVAQGIALLRRLPGNVLLLGEMGIGNTSAASLLMSRLTGLPIEDCTGAGTGLDAAGVQRKIEVLRAVLQRHAQAREPLQALAALGGLEIATMVGAVLAAAEQRRVIVVDGFITTAAVLVAARLRPHVLQRCVFAHRSGERGHALLLAHLKAEPLLDLGLRLGEGSGAALAWPLLVSACAILREMASFGSAGVARRLEEAAAVEADRRDPADAVQTPRP